jgi:aerobic carbon-monoxide dehydrogenase large subunit
MCGLPPSRWLGEKGYVAGGWEVQPYGCWPPAELMRTGTLPHGQGHETTCAQVAADALGIPDGDVDVIHGDTLTAPFGLDTYG